MDLIDQDRFDIIHYNGHGYFDYDNSRNNFIFFWQGKNSGTPLVALNAFRLSSKLSRTKKLKFFYLSCCQGATAESGYRRYYNTFLSLLDAVVSAGVPAALGMRWPITISNARSFARAFYTSLFVDKSVTSIESAVARARNEALGYGDQSVWCSPVLIKQDF